MSVHIDPDLLTPGLLDGTAQHAFTTGACSALAIALHDATGWPIVAITDHHNVMEQRGRGAVGVAQRKRLRAEELRSPADAGRLLVDVAPPGDQDDPPAVGAGQHDPLAVYIPVVRLGHGLPASPQKSER
jgi:hypothetical protein